MDQLKTDMANPIIVSKFKTSNRILYFIGIVLFCFLSYISFSKYRPNNFTTYPGLIIGCCFIFFAAYIIYYIISLPKIIVYTDEIELHRFLGLQKRTLFLSEINSWLVVEKQHKYGNYEIFYLTINETETLKISSSDYSNFNEIQPKIIRNKPQNSILKNKLDRKDNFTYSITLTILGLLFLYFAFQFYSNTSLTKNDIYTIKGRLSEDIKIERHKKSRSLVFKLENWKDHKFKIGSLALKETHYEDLMHDFKKGNEIYLTIEKEQYLKKISKTLEMSFIDKYFHYEKIEVVEVENKGFKYLSLSDFNTTNQKNDFWAIGFFGIFGLPLTIAGICIYPKTVKTTPDNKSRHL